MFYTIGETQNCGFEKYDFHFSEWMRTAVQNPGIGSGVRVNVPACESE